MAKNDTTPDLELAELLGLDPQTVGKAQRAYPRIFALVSSRESREALITAAVAEAGLTNIGSKAVRAIVRRGADASVAGLTKLKTVGRARTKRFVQALASADLGRLSIEVATSADVRRRTRAFFKSSFQALDIAESGYLDRAETRCDSPSDVAATSALFASARSELGDVQAQLGSDSEANAAFAQFLGATSADQLMSAQVAAVSTDLEGFSLDFDDIAKILFGILKKLAGLVPGPIGKILEDLIDIGEVIYDKLTQGEDPFEKLGRDIDKVEKKAANLTTAVTGSSAYTDDTEQEVAPPPTGEITPGPLKGSVLWFALDIERKLETVRAFLRGNGIYDRDADGHVVVPNNVEDNVKDDLWELKSKIDTLAALLSKTLVAADVKWNPEPPEGTTPRDNPTPKKAIKEELHEIEACLKEIKMCIEILKETIPPTDGPPPENPPRVFVEREVKRIFIYEEDAFRPTNAQPTKLVRVRTPAFDLGGWIDLTELRDGDQVELAVFVILKNPAGGTRRRRYRSATFAGRANRGLKNLHDVTQDAWLVGDAVDIRIRQTASADGFGTPLTILYQFVVESQIRR